MNFILKCSKTFPIGCRPLSYTSSITHAEHFLSLINISENHHKIVFKSRYAKCPPSLLLRAARLTEQWAQARCWAGSFTTFSATGFSLLLLPLLSPPLSPYGQRSPPLSLSLAGQTVSFSPLQSPSRFPVHVHKSPEFLPYKRTERVRFTHRGQIQTNS